MIVREIANSYKLQLTERQEKLLEFVKQQHGDQLRKYTHEPYWTHVFSVAQIVSEFVQDELATEIALCHDLFEDTPCDPNKLFYNLRGMAYSQVECMCIVFGAKDLTDKYTKGQFPDLNRKERKKLEAQRLGGIRSVAQSVKYADLIDNLSSIVQHDKSFAKVYLKEKAEILKYMDKGNAKLLEKCLVVYRQAVEELDYTP